VVWAYREANLEALSTSQLIRGATFIVCAALAVVLFAAACGGDGDGGSTPTRTAQFLPDPLSIEDALAELDEIIDLVRNPDPSVVEATNIGQFELDTRINEAVDGTPGVPGLNEVREELVAEDRILTGEYLHNNLVETLAVPFSQSDTASIAADAMEELDPRHVFADAGSNFEVSSIFREAVIRIIELWYLI